MKSSNASPTVTRSTTAWKVSYAAMLPSTTRHANTINAEHAELAPHGQHRVRAEQRVCSAGSAVNVVPSAGSASSALSAVCSAGSAGSALTVVISIAVAVACVSLLHGAEPLAQDRGATGTWQRLLKLRTIASVMHTTAHPDDEHGGLLTMLSRGDGARVTLLTLTRGESGDNAIGSELFDALGLIRTEELLRADQYYGVDQQYFTTVIDYGFSKRLEEALVKWGRENVLRDVVRVIRMERPLVLIARFQGNERDGHGNHQTAGLITQDAYRVAGDPNVFPEQIRDGLRAWQPLKLYMGGVRESEAWTIRVDPAVYSPWLGESYANFARTGLSFQRSQNGGRNDPQPGPAYGYYKRLATQVSAPDRETSFFDGIDTSLTGLFTTLKHPAPANAGTLLDAIKREVDAAVQAFRLDDPAASAPALARGLAATREALRAFSSDADATRMLEIKEQQFVDAINTALGVEFTAIAQPPGVPEPTGPMAVFAPPPTMGPVVPGQTFDVRIRFTNHGSPVVTSLGLGVSSGSVRLPASRVERAPASPAEASGGGGKPDTTGEIKRDQTVTRTAPIIVPADAPFTRPYFTRHSIIEDRYTVLDPKSLHRPWAGPAFFASADYIIERVPVHVRVPVMRREAQLPYGYMLRELAVVPALAVTTSPRQVIVPLSLANKAVRVQVELTNNDVAGSTGQLVLKVPAGWTSEPASIPFAFARSGEKARYQFTVSIPAIENRDYAIEAVATANGREFHEGYDVIEHRDLDTRYLYREATSQVRGIDVEIAPRLNVGYVMGVGDDVPSGIAQLGARLQLLGEQDLASGNLQQFDAIVTGTRAYAVREDLKTYNQRLLEYVKNGGNLVVLYNTPAEFDPHKFAPYPAELPRNAEEVSEEDSPVEILAASRPEFTTPNMITKADFEGWVEQRGSKFFSEWDKAYTPMIETHDQGQPPQRGGWVTANYGKGHYTYFAYAFHRQLPYGVPGAYRLLANLLSLGRN
jgi:LmbE family N-acetylglucosaminyl deacetylase